MTHRCRLYLITPPVIDDADAFVAQLQDAISGGDIACLQIRLKDRADVSASDDHIRDVTRKVLPIAQAAEIAVLINDRPDLAAELGADGVHVGQSDMAAKAAREIVGPDAIVGVTCHDSRHLGMEAGEQGADYVAFGAFYPTDTKDPRARAAPELLEWWQEMIEIPCVAIGGIAPENAEPLVRAGADFLAVSGGVWNGSNGPKAAVEAFNAIFDAVASQSD